MTEFDFNKFQIGDLDKIIEQSRQMMEALESTQDELATVAGSGEAAEGLVKVTVGIDGKVRSIDLNPRAMRLASQTLSEGIMEAIQIASADAEAKAAELFSGAFGSASPSVADTDQIQAQFRAIQDRFSSLMDEKENSLDQILRSFKDLR
jgi:DNA-binding protein YbaB